MPTILPRPIPAITIFLASDSFVAERPEIELPERRVSAIVGRWCQPDSFLTTGGSFRQRVFLSDCRQCLFGSQINYSVNCRRRVFG